ncbi:Ail/Lom family outer membrane beta-barrel protein [Buttiauxella sp. A2-C2_NF]|uniref:Ail/Lom family outer membrane beta-barrel protein n=1 Tax=Buttiauxella ferragutiae TaxID=82989 RepID=UPI001E312E36|nr:Ail/Lom family outer membrane beta-barrel protein [Buttiauxella ferragutiae]MCE0829056.1 Ail/Lom family outer membrane beta-barrel protein [Buttiauxella ferragutiae]UNK63205.1 Ail/Lom family outer membrane beta-barrel protein [Buttiauxella ferragutiae]
MKKVITGLALAGCVMASPVALAANQTVSVGYAHSKIDNAFDLNGINLQYRYEWDASWGVMGSFSWMKGDKTYHGDFYTSDAKAKYYSLTAGPTYRINDWISLYGALGFAHVNTSEDIDYFDSSSEARSGNSTSLAWGAGVIFNPVENLSVNVGYEGTNADYWNKNYAINGFNVGVGWRF